MGTRAYCVCAVCSAFCAKHESNALTLIHFGQTAGKASIRFSVFAHTKRTIEGQFISLAMTLLARLRWALVSPRDVPACHARKTVLSIPVVSGIVGEDTMATADEGTTMLVALSSGLVAGAVEAMVWTTPTERVKVGVWLAS